MLYCTENILIAHRGESMDAPENTIASINLAWERGINAVEIDIHLTADNEIVVIHDKDTYRISGIKKQIKNSTLAELQLLDVGSFKSKRWSNEKIPTLRDVLQTVPEHGKLIIEIKSDGRILNKLKKELEESKLKPSQIEIIAFNIHTLSEAKQLMPNYKMLWLLDLDFFWLWWLLRINKQRIIQKVKSRHLDGVNVWAGKLLTSSFISEFKNADLLVYAWTVNDPLQARLLSENKIDGITSDCASKIKSQLKQ